MNQSINQSINQIKITYKQFPVVNNEERVKPKKKLKWIKLTKTTGWAKLSDTTLHFCL